MGAIGHIKLYRALTEWEWYDDINTCRLFIHLLLEVNWKPEYWKSILIERGQKSTSYDKLSRETGLTVQQVRTSLNKLKSTGEVTIKSTSKYTIVTINNYDKYQDNNKQDNEQITNNQQSNNKQITTIEEDNKLISKEKNIYMQFGEFRNVKLTEIEYQKLIGKWNLRDIENKIASLDTGIVNGNKKYIRYKNHYATILNWLKKDCQPKTVSKCEVLPDTQKVQIREGATLAEIMTLS